KIHDGKRGFFSFRRFSRSYSFCNASCLASSTSSINSSSSSSSYKSLSMTSWCCDSSFLSIFSHLTFRGILFVETFLSTVHLIIFIKKKLYHMFTSDLYLLLHNGEKYMKPFYSKGLSREDMARNWRFDSVQQLAN